MQCCDWCDQSMAYLYEDGQAFCKIHHREHGVSQFVMPYEVRRARERGRVAAMAAEPKVEEQIS